MADFLEFEQEEVTGQLRQLALAIRGLVDCFSVREECWAFLVC